MSIGIAVTFCIRRFLVMLFFPFSVTDKLFNFYGAVRQASEIASQPIAAKALIKVGLFVEIVMSRGIITGVGDPVAGFVPAGYCMTTAFLWMQFRKPSDFWTRGGERELFWDFLLNSALAGGLFLITFFISATTARSLLVHPTLSSDPYWQEAATQ